MDRMIKNKSVDGSQLFYEELAADYDSMTGFKQRFVREQPFFRMLVDRYHIRHALDAGCGTGFHSILLAQCGVQVTANDIAKGMLRETQRHAKEYGVRIRTLSASFSDLPKVVGGTFDAVFCMGNSLAHLLTERNLHRALMNFRQLLKPDGLLFFQLVNYDRILRRRERVQSIKEGDGKIFLRFYDYERSQIRFNILTVNKTDEGMTHTLKSVMLHPWTSTEVLRSTRTAGFTDTHVFGGIALQQFNRKTSNDMVVLARQTQRL